MRGGRASTGPAATSKGSTVNSRRSRLLAWGSLSAGAVILLSACTSDAVDSFTTSPAATTSAPSSTTGIEQEATRLAAEQSAAAASRLAQEEAARVAAEQEAARLAAEEAARIEAERVAAEQSAAEQAAAEAEEEAAEQAAAEEAERQAAEEQAAAEQVERDAAENGWYSSNWGWVSPETAKRALAAGIPPGGDVPGYLRCGTICGESPTSGEVQSWNQGLEPVPPGYESYLAPNATLDAGESEGH